MATMPSEILWAYLTETAALFTDPDDNGTWPLYINQLPDGNETDNTAASLSDTAGLYDGKAMNGTINQHYGIQIRLRALADTDAYEKAYVVEDTLKDVTNTNVTIQSGEIYRINNISQAGPIVRMGPDEKRRANYSINMLMSLTLV